MNIMTLAGRFATPKIALGLGSALALSVAANGVLFWKLAGAKPEARLECVQGNLDATVSAVAAEVSRDEASTGIARDSATAVERSAVEAQTNTDTTKQEIRYVYINAPKPVVGTCAGEPPAGVRDKLEALRQRANAPGG